MNWARRFRIRERVRGSLWILALLDAVLGSILGVALTEVDRHTDLPNYFQYSSSTASTVLTAIVGAAAALTGFVVTVTAHAADKEYCADGPRQTIGLAPLRPDVRFLHGARRTSAGTTR
jgi:uncharacterized membrane protein